jgi:hypothetical protein
MLSQLWDCTDNPLKEYESSFIRSVLEAHQLLSKFQEIGALQVVSRKASEQTHLTFHGQEHSFLV